MVSNAKKERQAKRAAKVKETAAKAEAEREETETREELEGLGVDDSDPPPPPPPPPPEPQSPKQGPGSRPVTKPPPVEYSTAGELENGRLLTNHFDIHTGDATKIFQYSVSMLQNKGDKGLADKQPPKIIKRRLMFLLRKKLISRLAQANRGKLPSSQPINIATDYDNFLFTVVPLPEELVKYPVEIDLYEEIHDGPNQGGQKFNAAINGPTELPLAALSEHLKKPETTPEPDNAARDAILRGLNAILGSRPSHATFADLNARPAQAQTIFCVGKNKFYEQNQTAWNMESPSPPPWDVMNGLHAHVGISMSAKVPSPGIPGRLLMNLNTATSAFYQSGPLTNLISQYGTGNPVRLETFLKGLRVATTYRHYFRQPEMVQTITGLPSTRRLPTAGNETTNANGPAQSICAYFNARGVKGVRDDDIVVCLAGRGGIYPARYVDVLPGPSYKEKMDMATHAVRKPAKNRLLIEGPAKELLGIVNQGHPRFTESPGNRFLGISLGSQMLDIPFSRLRGPRVHYTSRNNQNTGPLTQTEITGGGWDLQYRCFREPAKVTPWRILDLSGTDPRLVTRFQTTLSTEIGKYGISGTYLGTQALQLGSIDDTQSLNSAENQLFAQIHRYKQQESNFVLFILLPSKDADTYGMVKRVGDQALGVPTICHVCKMRKYPGENEKLSMKNKKPQQKAKSNQEEQPDQIQKQFGPDVGAQFIGNLLMKYNLKARSNTVNQEFSAKIPILDKNTMLMGMDVTHPGGNSTGGCQSVAAAVGSVNDAFSQYPASYRENGVPEAKGPVKACESIMKADELTQECIERWRKRHNGAMPKKLIVYRDGLSEQQFDMCRTHELPGIREGIQQVITNSKLKNAKPPKILLICTVKRHHTRFFQDDKKPSNAFDGNQNPMPGCLVDRGITLHREDFFLISHKAIIGTARPTHYVILENELDKTDTREIAIMTHSLCYLFGRSTTSVSLAPPAYYADLACNRARCYARRFFSPSKTATGQGQPLPGRVTWSNQTDQWDKSVLDVHPDLRDRMLYI